MACLAGKNLEIMVEWTKACKLLNDALFVFRDNSAEFSTPAATVIKLVGSAEQNPDRAVVRF